MGVDSAVATEIRAHLEPPFEEVFDEAEEHAIIALHEAWTHMWDQDQRTYSKVSAGEALAVVCPDGGSRTSKSYTHITCTAE